MLGGAAHGFLKGGGCGHVKTPSRVSRAVSAHLPGRGRASGMRWKSYGVYAAVAAFFTPLETAVVPPNTSRKAVGKKGSCSPA
jgi:hypothetical protein